MRRAPIVAALVGILTGGLALPAAGQVVVDDFSTVQAELEVPPGTAASSSTGGPGIVGLNRDIVIDQRAGAGTVTAEVTGGALVFTVAAATTGAAELTWDGDTDPSTLDPVGLVNQDLTASNASAFRLVAGVTTSPASVIVEVYTDGANSSRSALLLPVGASQSHFLPYSLFQTVLGTGADFSDVGAIVLTIVTADGGVTVDDFDTAAPAVSASKVDFDGGGTPIAGTPVTPGTAIDYRVTIGNTGGSGAGTTLSDTVDPNTMPSGSFRSTPLARDDLYQSFGNLTLTVPDGPNDLIANDADFDGDAVTATVAAGQATVRGGTVDIAADGSFTYAPPAGFTGVDSFTYALELAAGDPTEDANGNPISVTGTATIDISNVIWFVDDSVGGPGTGTQADPFSSFAPINGAGGAGDLDVPGDLIYVRTGSGATDTGGTDGFELEAGQELLGEGVALVVGGSTVVPAGTRPVLTNTAGTAGPGITLAADNTVRGLNVGATAGMAFKNAAMAPVGTLTVDTAEVSGAGGIMNISFGGTLDVTFDNAGSTSNTGRGISLDSVGGAFTVTGATSIDATTAAAIYVRNAGTTAFDFGATTIGGGSSVSSGINIATSGSATFTFDSLAVTTSSGPGVLANAAGTMTVSGATNSISATGGAAVDVTNTSLGAGWTFSSVSSTSSPGSGINLDAVSAGTFTANGGAIAGATGVAFDVNQGSANVSYGGSIANTSGRSVEVTNRMGGTLTFSGVIDDDGTGIHLASNSGTTINFTGGVDLDTSATAFTATGGGTINATGTNTIDVAGTAAHAIDLDGVTIGTSNLTFLSITAAAGTTADGLDFDSVSGGTLNGGTVTVNGTDSGAGIDIATSSAVFVFTSATIDAATGDGIKLTSNSGSVTVSAGAVGGTNDPSGNGIDVSGGAASVSISAAITKTTAGRVVEVTGRDGGTVTIGGDLSCTAACTGVNVASNTGGSTNLSGTTKVVNTGANTAVSLSASNSHTISFTNGGLDIDTTSGNGIDVVGGATVNITGSNNSITTTTTGTGFEADGGGTLVVTGTAAIDTTAGTGTAVDIAGTTIGANDVTFRRIDVDGSTGPAIVLTNTGAGDFVVTGTDGPCGNTVMPLDCDGGTIENLTNTDAIRLDNTDGAVRLSYLLIEDIAAAGDAGAPIGTRSGVDAIHGQSVDGGLVLDHVTIRRVSDNAVNGSLFADGISLSDFDGLEIRDSEISETNRFHVAGFGDDADEGGVRINGVTGTVVVDNSLFQDAASGLDLLSVPGSGTLDVTIQGSTFTDIYKEFACSGPGTVNVGRRAVTVQAEGSQDVVVRIGDPAEADPLLGNEFTNALTASVVVNGQAGGGTPHTGTIETVISRNDFVVTDHLTGPSGCPTGTLAFNFPNGGVSINPAAGTTLEAIVSNNLFDQVFHAAGGLGQLTLGLNGGDSQIIVRGNTFQYPIDAAVEVRADANNTAAVLFQNNSVTDGLLNGFGTDWQGTGLCPPAGCQSPFNPFLANVRNGGRLDLEIDGDDLGAHDTANSTYQNSFDASLNSSGGTFNLHLTSVKSAEGYGFDPGAGTTLDLFAEAGCAGPPTEQAILQANGNTGGGGIDGTTPPTVTVSGAGSVACSTTALTPPNPTIP